MGEYVIHETRRGDYGVQRADQRVIIHREDGSEARFSSREEAEVFVSQRQQEEAERAAEHERWRTEHQAHDRMMVAEAGDLVTRQLAWQEWRNEFYARMRHAGRAASYLAAKPAGEHGTRSPGYGEYQRGKQDRAIAEAAELQQAYARAVVLDAAIKAAYAHGEPRAYEEALAAGEALMREWGETPATPAPAVDEKRTAQLLMRLTPSERDQVQADAAAIGLTVSDYLRDRLGLTLR